MHAAADALGSALADGLPRARRGALHRRGMMRRVVRRCAADARRDTPSRHDRLRRPARGPRRARHAPGAAGRRASRRSSPRSARRRSSSRRSRSCRPSDRAPLDAAHAALPSYDFAIFVSANAVEYGAPAAVHWPAALVAFAPGPGTAEALAAVGIRRRARSCDDLRQRQACSRCPNSRDVRGRRVGDLPRRGRARALSARRSPRAARTSIYVACYRRAAPSGGAAGLAEAFSARPRSHAVTITSSEGVDNLWRVLADDATRAGAARCPTFVPHPRIAEHARGLGLAVVETAGGDAGLLAGLARLGAGARTQCRPGEHRCRIASDNDIIVTAPLPPFLCEPLQARLPLPRLRTARRDKPALLAAEGAAHPRAGAGRRHRDADDAARRAAEARDHLGVRRRLRRRAGRLLPASAASR
ncbi:MAG: uroporphyrinogen-III synthase [Comamonadaceae bacterium]|nr:uroporphyrinogen-III synthase [Comamonadaceae bacterium]